MIVATSHLKQTKRSTMNRGNKHQKIPLNGRASSCMTAKVTKKSHVSNSVRRPIAPKMRPNLPLNDGMCRRTVAAEIYLLTHARAIKTLLGEQYFLVQTMFTLIWGFIKALYRDIIGVLLYLKFQVQFHKVTFFNETVITKFDALANNDPQKVAIIYKDEQISFQELQHRSYRISNWLEQTMNIGLSNEFVSKIADTEYEPEQPQVGLMLGNIPEMPAFLLGIARVRATAVLFNVNQKNQTLLNAFRVTKCRVVVFEKRYLENLRQISSQLDANIWFVMYDRNSDIEDCLQTDKNNNEKSQPYKWRTDKYHGVSASQLMNEQQNFKTILNNYSVTPPRKLYNYSLHDYIAYIFTSGTTGGSIKATPIDNIRYIVGYLSQMNAFGLTKSDIIYIPLPLFHIFPVVVGLGRCILGSNTIALADKFSASGFWLDCVRYQCTVALYIGETCRYLLAQPVRPEETRHVVRMMHGLGMRKDIWREFAERFKIPKIAEFYGSSEGNINLFNRHSVEGSCGFIPYYFGPLQRFLFPIYLIHIDPITLKPIRTKQGLCKLARPGQTALAVGQIKEHLPYTKFLGYTNGKEESSKKILRDILSFGDYAFSSGDLMEMDIYGNLYFRDRTGDTFRYKGENVSTTEIEEITSTVLPKKTVFTCYGVEVPNCDGRVGMLAIEKPKVGDLDLETLYKHLSAHLPDYAVPKFIRLTDKIETTSTHKLIKYRLREASFRNDDNFKNDQVFYIDKVLNKYVLLDPAHEAKVLESF